MKAMISILKARGRTDNDYFKAQVRCACDCTDSVPGPDMTSTVGQHISRSAAANHSCNELLRVVIEDLGLHDLLCELTRQWYKSIMMNREGVGGAWVAR
jgi:hypothetical protein